MSGKSKGFGADKDRIVQPIMRIVAGEMRSVAKCHGKTYQALMTSLPKRVACQLYAAGWRRHPDLAKENLDG